MIKRINVLSLIGAIVCFVFAAVVAKGKSGIMFSNIENEMFTFALAFTVGVFFCMDIQKD